MKIVTAAEMREIDRRTSRRYRVPSLTLMENAGTAVAELVLANHSGAETFGVICGKGNNGGDGFVAARKLHEAAKDVQVLLLARPHDVSGDAAKMLKQLPVTPIPVRTRADLRHAAAASVFKCDVLLDAVLGTGFRPPLSPLCAAAIEKMWQSRRPVVAVDIPSGMTADYELTGRVSPRAPASEIVSFTAAKPCLVFDPALAALPSVVAQIGSPDEAITSALALNVTTASDALACIPPRPADSHKGLYGHVLVIGGSLGKSGAAAMAGIAALRAGAGLVTIAAPRSQLAIIAAHAPELMTEPLDETSDGTISLRNLEGKAAERLLRGKTVLALGPGISTHPETQEFVRRLLATSNISIVLDADGLNAFAGRAQVITGRTGLILTPHPGEMARLAGCSTEDVQRDRIGTARRFAAEHSVVLVLKGYRTLTAHPDGHIWVNTTGNPALSKGGTGDVLTGIVAGLTAQSLSRRAGAPAQNAHRRRSGETTAGGFLSSAAAAVYLHGLAADIAREQLEENCVLATDVIASLPHAFRAARERAESEPRFVRIN